MVHSCCLLASWSASEEVSGCRTCGERGLPGRPRGTFSRTRAASTVGLIPASGRLAPSLSTTDGAAGDALSVLRLTCSSRASGPSPRTDQREHVARELPTVCPRTRWHARLVPASWHSHRLPGSWTTSTRPSPYGLVPAVAIGVCSVPRVDGQAQK